MGYVIRNYGETRQIPFKNGFISIGREQAIETDDPEVVSALSGIPQVNVAAQPGTIVTSPPSEPPVAEEIEEDIDEEDEDSRDESADDGEQDDDDNEDEFEEPEESDESEEEDSPDYASMSKRELLDLAKERNLATPDTIRKEALITLLLTK